MSEDILKKRAKLQALLSGQPVPEVNEIRKVMLATEEVAEQKGLPKVPITESKSKPQDNDDLSAFKTFNLRESVSKYPTPNKPVSEDAISALLAGDKKKAKQVVEEEREVPDELFDVRKQIQDRAKAGKAKTKDLPKSKLIAEGIDNNYIEQQEVNISKEEIRSLIQEEIRNFFKGDGIKKIASEEIYKILAEVYEVEQKDRLMTETIHVRIGETIFSGSLKPLSKVKKK